HSESGGWIAHVLQTVPARQRSMVVPAAPARYLQCTAMDGDPLQLERPRRRVGLGYVLLQCIEHCLGEPNAVPRYVQCLQGGMRDHKLQWNPKRRLSRAEFLRVLLLRRQPIRASLLAFQCCRKRAWRQPLSGWRARYAGTWSGSG